MATILRRARHAGRAARQVPAPKSLQPVVPAPPVTVVVRPDVLRSIAAFAGASPGRETGGPLIGTIQRSWEEDGERLIVSILATVPPSPVLRAGRAHVGLGHGGDGERAASALRWWRAVTGLDLRHLGDWHKHPSGLPEPSSGDEATARRISVESDLPIWVTAVAVGAARRAEEAKTDGNVVRFAKSWQTSQQVRFYVARDRGGLAPVRVRVEEDAVPRLPALPWHVRDPVRFAAECRLLHDAGFRVGVEPWTGTGPGIAFRLRRDGSSPLEVVTGPGYPVRPPVVLNGGGRRIDVADWSPARFLVDVARKGS